MPQFNVGDRVRCVDPRDELEHGHIYTIEEVDTGSGVGTFYWVGQNRNFRGAYSGVRFELVEAAPPPVPMQEITFYSVVYQTDPAAIKEIRGFETMASYERFKLSLQRIGGIVLATKKIKTNIPVVEN